MVRELQGEHEVLRRHVLIQRPPSKRPLCQLRHRQVGTLQTRSLLELPQAFASNQAEDQAETLEDVGIVALYMTDDGAQKVDWSCHRN